MIRYVYSLFIFPVISLLAIGFTLPASAYYVQHLTGQIVPVDSYSLGANLQFLSNGIKGTNVVASGETGLNEASTVIVRAGFGEIDFTFSGDYKWVPIPDAENQPSLGVAAGLLYANFDGDSEFSIKAAPFVSKKFPVQIGDLTPYAALPFFIRNISGKTDSPVQLVLGLDWKTLYWDNVFFNIELGAEIDDAFNYFAIGAQIEFDDKRGLEIKSKKR